MSSPPKFHDTPIHGRGLIIVVHVLVLVFVLLNVLASSRHTVSVAIVAVGAWCGGTG